MMSFEAEVDGPAPWERQTGEGARQFHAFVHYRDLGTGRSITRALNAHRETCQGKPASATWRSTSGRWRAWSVDLEWGARCTAYDKWVDEQDRLAAKRGRAAAVEQHAKAVRLALLVTAAPIRALADAMTDPKSHALLKAAALSGVDGWRKAFGDGIKAAQLIPALIQAERLTLGLHTSHEALSEGPAIEEAPVDIGQRIASDPEATRLAIQLLDRVAGTTDGDPFRNGPARGSAAE
jgi:hypothetical protein